MKKMENRFLSMVEFSNIVDMLFVYVDLMY